MTNQENSLTAKNSAARHLAAGQIRQARRMEKSSDSNEPYNMNRGAVGYESTLYGISNFFDYLSEIKESDLIIDVGAGSLLGTSELRSTPFGYGFSYVATGLTLNPQHLSRFGKENYKQTSVEELHGIADNSVAGILAVCSLAYSAAPELAIQRIDEVLVPGGAIKASFRSQVQADRMEIEDALEQPIFQIAIPFFYLLKSFGYDVATIEKEEYEIVLAIKPGGKGTTTAEQLLLRDKYDFDMQSIRTIEGLQDLVVDGKIRSLSLVPGDTSRGLLKMIHTILDRSGISYDKQAIDLNNPENFFTEVARIKQELESQNPNKPSS